MTYWRRRQEAAYRAGELSLNKYYTRLEKAFNGARRSLEQATADFYWRYAEENGLTYVAAQRQLNKAELKDLQSFVNKAMKNVGRYNQEVNNLSIKARVTRYQALEAQVDAILRQLYAVNFQADAEKTLKEIYKDTYYKTWYNIDKYHSFHAAFAQVEPRTVEKLLEYPFDGANFSSRLWKQKDHLQGQLMESLTTGLIRGDAPHALVDDFAKKMKSKKADAYRLLHTESSYLISEATHAAYKEDGVEEYQILATLDSKTCDICGEYDGKIYPVSKAVTGVNKPPFHPYCRCTDIPYYPEDQKDLNRIARDQNDENYLVPGNMSYADWQTEFVDGEIDLAGLYDHMTRSIPPKPISKISELSPLIADMPHEFSNVINKNADKITFATTKSKGHAHCTKEGIYVNFKKDRVNKKGAWTGTFHEIGHAIDAALGRPSESEVFSEALHADFEVFIKEYKDTEGVNRLRAYKLLSEELREAEDKDSHVISDLFGGLTGNECIGKYGHKSYYWKKAKALEHEAFAHFFSAGALYQTKVEIIQSIFPTAYQYFLEMIR